MTQVLNRTGTVNYQVSEQTIFKELVQGKDFVVKDTIKHIRMDFDMKRKPVRNSFYANTVAVEGVSYEIANFTTIPFRTVVEFKEYRQRKATVSCLRTMDDQNIPKLDELQGADRDAWINSHNTSSKIWKPNDWKNAGRNARQANMLPRELLEEKLQELIDDQNLSHIDKHYVSHKEQCLL